MSMFKNQSVLITGANRGIGLALTKELLLRGHSVTGTARKVEEATELRALATSPKLDIFALDVGSNASCVALAASLTGRRIDVLVNNSGVANGAGLLDLNDDDFHRIMDINALGPLRVTRALLANLRSSKTRIFHISSRMGSIGDGPEGAYYAYRMSKAALNMAGANLAHELRGDGITSILVHPGWVQTDMGGKNATLTPAASTNGIADLIESKGFESSGNFFNYDGQSLSW